MSASHALGSPWMHPCTSHSSSSISAPSLQKHRSMSLWLMSAGWPAITAPGRVDVYTSEDFISISYFDFIITVVPFEAERLKVLRLRSAPATKQVAEFTCLAKETLALRTHFGNGRNQIRRGTAKQKKADCNGLMSRVKQEKLTAGGRTLVHRSCGKSLRIPANTKNIPVSNSTEIKWASMSPVATGKLSRLSSCINGENTTISTINRSTIFGVLRCINLCRSVMEKGWSPAFGDCSDYSTAVTNGNV